MRFPSKKQWVQVSKLLTRKEKTALLTLAVMFSVSLISSLAILYAYKTETSPGKGGTYSEGMAGSPRFINPIYAQGSDVDRSLVEIIFSGLMNYDSKGQIVYDLAQSLETTKDGKAYDIYLKENLQWHDGEPLTADDVIFTIKTIQGADYKSPLRGNYLGVEVEKISENGVRFKLKEAYPGFLERLTFKIIPKHIWENITPQNFLLSNYNIKPVGSGPFRFKDLKQDGSNKIISVNLARFGKANISEINIKFFDTEEELFKAARSGKIDGFSLSNPEYYSAFSGKNINQYSLRLPRYFAVFFNADKTRFLGDNKIRKALNFATNKQEIAENILLNRAQIVNSPMLPEIFGLNMPDKIYEFDQEKARDLLKEAGLLQKDNAWMKIEGGETVEFKSDLKQGSQGNEVNKLQTCLARYPEIYPEGKVTGYFGAQTKEAVIKFQEKYAKEILEPSGFTEGTGLVAKSTRTKLNEICSAPAKENQLKFTLATVDDIILKKVAENLREQWAKAGIKLEVQTYPVSQLEQEVIKPRNYEMLLFGEVLDLIPDPYPFWHSSQVKDPGLNLAKYENKSVDKLLESARINLNPAERAKKYQDFQQMVINDAPVLFIYSPDYIYYVKNNVKGIEMEIISDPSKRFANIENWFINTQRTWK